MDIVYLFQRAGKFDVSRAEENQIPKMLWSRLQKGERRWNMKDVH